MKHIQTSLCLALVIFSHVVVATETNVTRYLNGYEKLILELEDIGSSESCGNNFVMVAANARMRVAMEVANLSADLDLSNFTMEQGQKNLELGQRMVAAQLALNQKQVRCL